MRNKFKAMTVAQLHKYYDTLESDLRRCLHQYSRMREINIKYAVAHEYEHTSKCLEWKRELRTIELELETRRVGDA